MIGPAYARKFLRGSLCGAALAAAVSGVPVAFAQDSSALIPKIQLYADIPQILQMEETIHTYGVSGDISGVNKLAETIRSQDGATLDELTAIVTSISERMGNMTPEEMVAGAAWKEDPRAKVIFAMGPCHYAGMQARLLALRLADGSMKPAQRNGRTMVDGTSLDTDFATQMTRCQMIRSRPPELRLDRKVGDMCQTTGVGCVDDPDLADQ